jgi:hypothetical protein
MYEALEAFSIEAGDTITLKDREYTVLDIQDGEFKDYKFRIMDDEGWIHYFEADSMDHVRVLLDPYVEA